MSSLKKLSLVGGVGLTGAALTIACAAEGGSNPTDPDPDGGSGQVIAPSPDAGADVETSDVREAGPVVEAGACSTSKLCTTSIPFDTRTNVTSIHGSGPNDIWAVGTTRSVFHYDGSGWEQSNVPDEAITPFTLSGVFADRPDHVWILDGPIFRHATGWKGAGNTEWSTVDLGGSFKPIGIDGRDGFVVVAGIGDGSGSLAKLDQSGSGGPVEFFGAPGISFAGFQKISFTRADEAWAQLYSGLYPDGWQQGAIARIYRDAPGSGTPAWKVERYDSRLERPLYGVWGNDESIWLVGEGGALRRITRDAVSTTRAFEIVAGPVTAALHDVYGFASNDVWAVGDESTVLHWDGHAWTKLTTPLDTMSEKPRLLAVWGSSKNDVWIGGNGVMLHFEGSAP